MVKVAALMSGQSERRSRSSRRRLVRNKDTLETTGGNCAAALIAGLCADDGVTRAVACIGLLVMAGTRVDRMRESSALGGPEDIIA